MSAWFTADLHLGHRNIVRLCERPFSGLREMEETLLKNVNARVSRNDDLYILGDFALGNKAKVEMCLDLIRCENVHLIVGNHDSSAVKLAKRFKTVSQIYEVSLGGKLIVMCHYPLRSWRASNRGSWHLHGHAHGRMSRISRALDVGVDACQMAPIDFLGVSQRMLTTAEGVL